MRHRDDDLVCAGYWVDGVQLVNVGGECCEACEQRPAVGRSVSGHAICARCAGWAATVAEELAAERDASRERASARLFADGMPLLRFSAREAYRDATACWREVEAILGAIGRRSHV